MYRKIDDFLAHWQGETTCTAGIIEQCTDELLKQEVCDGHRTLARMAWHMAITMPELLGQTGLTIEGPARDAPIPATAAGIKEAYVRTARSVADQVKAHWTDESLLTEDNLYGEVWPRGKSLHALVLHEVHHRGQMSVLLRQAGAQLPGIYGPSKEEWAAHNQPPPVI